MALSSSLCIKGYTVSHFTGLNRLHFFLKTDLSQITIQHTLLKELGVPSNSDRVTVFGKDLAMLAIKICIDATGVEYHGSL